MNIKDALRSLKTDDEGHWTGDGSARIDVIKELVGHPVNRQDIIDAAPDFNRESAKEPDTLLMNVSEDKGDEDDDADDEDNIDLEEDGDEDDAGEDEDEDKADAAILSLVEELVKIASSTPTKFIQMLSSIPKESLQELDNMMVTKYDIAMKFMERANQDMKQLQANMHSVRSRLRYEVPDMSNQEAIQEFIRKQNAVRAEKAHVRKTVLQGISAKDLDPRAPIDQAFARKNKRGTGRPVAPRR